jgi:predicted small metal-binding protein
MREDKDCAVASMAMFSGQSYEDVLRAVVIHDPKHHGRDGLSDHQIRRVMASLGSRVRHRARVDYEDDYGLLRLWNHLTLLRNGLIVENNTLWDVDDWRRYSGYLDDASVMGIFVAAE